MNILNIFKKKEKEEKSTYLTQTGIRTRSTQVPTVFTGGTPEEQAVWDRDLYPNKIFFNSQQN